MVENDRHNSGRWDITVELGYCGRDIALCSKRGMTPEMRIMAKKQYCDQSVALLPRWDIAVEMRHFSRDRAVRPRWGTVTEVGYRCQDRALRS